MKMAKQTPLTCSGHTRPVVDLKFSKITDDGYFLISSCKDHNPMLRHGNTGDWIGTFYGHKGAVWAATLNNDATKAATGSADFKAKIWDAVKGEELVSFNHDHIVKTVAFSTDCEKLLTGGQEKILRCFHTSKPESDPDVVAKHEKSIKKTLWMSNDRHCLSASEDKTIKKWDLDSRCSVQSINFPSVPTDMELSEDENILLVTYGDKIALYDARTLKEMRSASMPCPFSSASMHPKNKFIVGGGDNFKIYKFDYDTFEELESHKAHFGPVHTIRYSPDGELYASGSEDGTVRLWQNQVGKSYGLWCGEENSSDNSQ